MGLLSDLVATTRHVVDDHLPKGRRRRKEIADEEHVGATTEFALELQEMQPLKDPNGNVIEDELGYEIHQRFLKLERLCHDELHRIFVGAIKSLRIPAADEMAIMNKILSDNAWTEPT